MTVVGPARGESGSALRSHGVDNELFPATERILAWIADLASLGHRRTGTPEGRRSAGYIASAFRRAGLERVKIESAPTPCPTVHESTFTVGGERIDCFWVNGTGRCEDIGRFATEIGPDVEVIHLGAGWEDDFDGVDVAGKIVLCDIEFHPGTPSAFLEANPRAFVHDPAGTLERPTNKFDIYSPNNWPQNYFTALKRGAAGFVGSLQNYMDCFNYNEDYTDNGEAWGVSRMSIPAVWISKADGAAVVGARREDGAPMTGALAVDVEYELKDALNIHGVLPGASKDIVLVHSHHDAVFAGAVQDASGVAEVLALAEYFGRLPASDREKTLMFAATDTHFTDYVGHLAFLDAREESDQTIILDVCIEHIGKEVELDRDNNAIETGFVEPRIVYVSDESGMLDAVKEAFESHALDRTIFAPVSAPAHTESPYEFSADEVNSDAYYFAEAGIPVVSLVAGQMYLFHPSDTLDRVQVDQLRPVGLAFAQIVGGVVLGS